MAVEVKGLDEVLKNLNKEIAAIAGNVQKGITIAMTRIKGESMKRTPVDVGNLRASHYLVAGDGHKSEESAGFSVPTGKKATPSAVKSAQKVKSEHSEHVQEAAGNARSKRYPFAEIGCTAFYAAAVHEDLEAKHTTGGAKFLERSIVENKDKIVANIKRFAAR